MMMISAKPRRSVGENTTPIHSALSTVAEIIPTVESMADPAYKQMLVASNADDLIVSAGLTGTPASWLRPSLQANGLDPENLPAAPPRSYDSNQSVASKRWRDVWAAGQGVGAVKAVERVADVVARLAH